MFGDFWKCHICGRERPDEMIGVHKKKHVFKEGGSLTQNIRYCIDNNNCTEGAFEYDFLKKKKKEIG